MIKLCPCCLLTAFASCACKTRAAGVSGVVLAEDDPDAGVLGWDCPGSLLAGGGEGVGAPRCCLSNSLGEGD